MRRTIIIAVVTFTAHVACAAPELRGTPTELAGYLSALPASVVITGESKVKVQADQALVRLRVVTAQKTLRESLEKNQKLRNDLTRALTERGIRTDRITSAKFSSTPEYGRFSDKVKTYHVENQVQIKVESEVEFRTVAEAIEGREEVVYQSLEAECSKKDEQHTKALAQACVDVLRKKQTYEDQLHVKLTPKAITEVPVDPSDRQGHFAEARSRQPSFAGGLSTMTGILTDPSFRMTVNALEQRNVSDSFGELLFRAVITVEFKVERQN